MATQITIEDGLIVQEYDMAEFDHVVMNGTMVAERTSKSIRVENTALPAYPDDSPLLVAHAETLGCGHIAAAPNSDEV